MMAYETPFFTVKSGKIAVKNIVFILSKRLGP
jgi:hypothetical protein